MDRRRQSRVSSGIPVRIWGMDAKSRPFQASVSALNVSDTGALLQGIMQNLRVGDTIELQYEGQTTAYNVMWMGSSGTPQSGQVGLRRAANQPSPWSDLKLQYCVASAGRG